MSETGDFLKSREPNWISLQFVPYAYHLKGLPFRLPEVLDQLNKKFPVNWHIMFHEIGDDFGKGLALKDYLMAFFQKRIIIRLHRKLNILVSSTHSQTYRNSLKKWYPGIVKSLPLFSNINTSFAESKRASSLLGLDKANRKDYLIGLFFGNIQPFRAFSDSLKQFVIAAESRNLVPFIVHMGRLSLRYEQAWATATATLPEGVLVKRLGELPEKDVSSMIHLIDIGMSTTPWTLAEKSGGAYPFLEAGKHVWFLQDPLPGSPPLSEGFSKDIDVCIRNAPFLRPSLSVVAKTFLDQVSAAVR